MILLGRISNSMLFKNACLPSIEGYILIIIPTGPYILFNWQPNIEYLQVGQTRSLET